MTTACAPSAANSPSTVHAAKGQEFAQVVILDGGEWSRGERTRNERGRGEPVCADDDCRLFYVGMTRARENLILCQSAARAHPLLSAVRTIPPPATVDRPAALYLRSVSLGLSDVDLGFAGRCAADHRRHRLLAGLAYGQNLLLRHVNGRLMLIEPGSGVAVGALAKKFVLPAGEIVSVTLIRRSKRQSDSEYLQLLRVDPWWVPLVTLTLQPAVAAVRDVTAAAG